jgi:hypothetical protein
VSGSAETPPFFAKPSSGSSMRLLMFSTRIPHSRFLGTEPGYFELVLRAAVHTQACDGTLYRPGIPFNSEAPFGVRTADKPFTREDAGGGGRRPLPDAVHCQIVSCPHPPQLLLLA